MSLFNNIYKKKYERLTSNINELNKKNAIGYKTFAEYVYSDELMLKYFEELKKLEKKYTAMHVDTYEIFEKSIFEQLRKIYNNMLINILKTENINDKNKKLIEFEKDLANGIGHKWDKYVNKFIEDFNNKYKEFDKYVVVDNCNNINNNLSTDNYFSEEYDDPIYNEVLDFAISAGNITASLVQRKFKLGYNRAARIIDLLEERGIVGPENGSKPREVLVSVSNNNKSISFNNLTPNIIKMTDFEIEKNNEQNIRKNMTIEELMKTYGIEVDYKESTSSIKIKNTLILNSEETNKNETIKYLLKYNSPTKLKIILTKFEPLIFGEFEGIPHLLCPIITKESKMKIAIENVISEMDRRYELFVKTKVKSINDYNDFCETNKEHQKLPYIVIVVDEMFNFLQIKEISDLLVKLLLNSERAGIVFLAFSKFNKKNLNLGPIEDLLEIYNNYDISKLLVNIQNDNINDNMKIIDKDMDGFNFEKYAGELLKNNGFEKILVTKCSNDYGVDIVAYKDEVKYSIQCKKYSSPVGISAVQEVIASKVMNDSHVAVVLTNNYFTKSAKELANKNNVLLWDRTKLKELIGKRGETK